MNPIEKAYNAGVAYAVKTAAEKHEEDEGPSVLARILGGAAGGLGGGILGGEGAFEASRLGDDPSLEDRARAGLLGLSAGGIGGSVGGALSPTLGGTLAGGGIGSQLGGLSGVGLGVGLGGDKEDAVAAGRIGKLLGALGGGVGGYHLSRELQGK